MVSSKSEKRDLRLEMRVKNNLLWRAIHDLYPTVAAFCRAHGLHQTEVGELLSLRKSPFTKKGEYRYVVVRLSLVFGIAPKELFPAKVYAEMLKIGSFKSVEISSFSALAKAAQKEIRLLPAPVEQAPDVLCMKADLSKKSKEAIKTVLSTLSYRERKIIELRYGLFTDHEHTLDEVSKIFHLHRERIRQIEAKALRKLQQPHRSQNLEEFL